MKSLSNYVSESLQYPEQVQSAIESGTLDKSYLRIDSDSHAETLRVARRLFESNEYLATNESERMILEELRSGEKAISISRKTGRRKEVNLHIPQPNPTRADDSKRFIVWTDSGKTDDETGLPIAKAIRFASWGQGLDINNDDKAASDSFWARHQCDKKSDVNTAGFWACRTPELFGDMLKLRGGKSRW